MRRDLAELKIEALLHDPPGKSPMLWYQSHAGLADELVALALGRAPRHRDSVGRADRYASAVDRVVPAGRGDPEDLAAVRADFLRDPQIVHPLAGTRYELAPLVEVDLPRIETAQRRAMEDLARKAGSPAVDPERLYWCLWRGLPAAVEEAGELGKLWRYLPADTRVPDHPIWDHMRLTSAFAGALPEPALLVFSFGPVQSLIEAARRTGDLWAGSFLLSWLAWRAMRPIVAELGADAVLFPDLHGQPLIDHWLAERGWGDIPGLRKPSAVASLPNRFMALVPAAHGKRLAREAEEALRAAPVEFVENGAHDLDRAAPAGWRERANRQCAMTFTCQWHLLPWLIREEAQGRGFAGEEELRRLSEAVLGDSVGHFWQTRKLLTDRELYRPNLGTFFEVHSRLVESGLGAAKATRRFVQIDEIGERCRVCGTREALWGEKADREGIRPRGVEKGEWLCGVCWARRHAPRSAWARAHAGGDVRFPSTHKLAAARFFEEVLDALEEVGQGSGSWEHQAVAEAVKTFTAATRGVEAWTTELLIRRARRCAVLADTAAAFVKIPAELMDPATYDERSVAEGVLEDVGLERGRAVGARAALGDLIRSCRAAGIAPAHMRTYYAVLVMDGDSMGRWLSGELAPRIGEVLHTSVLPPGYAEWLERRRPLSSAHQVAVSRALNQFAIEVVPGLIEGVHGGVVVYAGGDDVLAMLPLHTLLGCLGDLRRLYSGSSLPESSAAAGGGWESGGGHVRRGGRLFQVMGERATTSMGVAIAHAKWPLRHALEKAREMERVAKRERRRNAVAVALLKRSGGHESFSARWGEGEGVGPLDPLAGLDEARALIAEGRVSRRFAYALREEAPTLWPLKDALEERALWLIRRHRRRSPVGVTSRGEGQAEGAAEPPEFVERARRVARGLRELAQKLDAWAEAASGDGARTSGVPQPVAQFRAAIALAEFLARGGGE